MSLNKLSLLPQEPETVRVVTIQSSDGQPCGAGCLVSNTAVLTCAHVVELAVGRTTGKEPLAGKEVQVALGGVRTQPQITAVVERMATYREFADDLALLRIAGHDAQRLAIRPVEFAAPMVHSGKTFSVMGFPVERDHGLHATGRLRGAERTGLVQMDGDAAIAVRPGFSGAPVWCPEVRAFVGLVVAAETQGGLAWLIPSRLLAGFFPLLPVKFRVPSGDRPIINDLEEDDPNLGMFGDSSTAPGRLLRAEVRERDKDYRVDVSYVCQPGGDPPRGQWVTFITYPDFEQDGEDAYELFARIEEAPAYPMGLATQRFYPGDLFTVAAIGDAGETALTLNLMSVARRKTPSGPAGRKRRHSK